MLQENTFQSPLRSFKLNFMAYIFLCRRKLETVNTVDYSCGQEIGLSVLSCICTNGIPELADIMELK